MKLKLLIAILCCPVAVHPLTTLAPAIAFKNLALQSQGGNLQVKTITSSGLVSQTTTQLTDQPTMVGVEMGVNQIIVNYSFGLSWLGGSASCSTGEMVGDQRGLVVSLLPSTYSAILRFNVIKSMGSGPQLPSYSAQLTITEYSEQAFATKINEQNIGLHPVCAMPVTASQTTQALGTATAP